MKTIFIWELPYEKSFGDRILDPLYIAVADSAEEARAMAVSFAQIEYEGDQEMLEIARQAFEREPYVYEVTASRLIRPCH